MAATNSINLAKLPTLCCGQCQWFNKRYKGKSCQDNYGVVEQTDACNSWEPDWAQLPKPILDTLRQLSDLSVGQLNVLQWMLLSAKVVADMETPLRLGDSVSYKAESGVLEGTVVRLWVEKGEELATMTNGSSSVTAACKSFAHILG